MSAFDITTITAPPKAELAGFASIYKGQPIGIRALVAAKICTRAAHIPGIGTGMDPSIITINDAAMAFDLNRGTVGSAKKVLDSGDQDKITAILQGRAIKERRKNKDERDALKKRIAVRAKKAPGDSDATGALIKTIIAAVKILSTAPAASDVAEVITRGLTTKEIETATSWMEGFKNAWGQREQ